MAEIIGSNGSEPFTVQISRIPAGGEEDHFYENAEQFFFVMQGEMTFLTDDTTTIHY